MDGIVIQSPLSKCSRCGAEISLFDSKVPICVRCDRSAENESVLRKKVQEARERHTADTKFLEIVKGLPSETHRLPEATGFREMQPPPPEPPCHALLGCLEEIEKCDTAIKN